MSGLFKPEELYDVPVTDWRPPDDLPDKLYGPIGLDLETRDDGLAAGAGAGWAWGGGRVVGYSVAADNFCGYLPIAHEGAGNLDPGMVRRWLNHVLADELQPKLGANVMYDLGWAGVDGVKVAGPVYDVQWAEALLDENKRTYSLESIARDRLGEGKDEGALREAAKAYGVDPKAGIWRLPPHLVGPYAEQDARLPRELWRIQEPLIQAEELRRVFDLEHALIPMYLDMRRRGIRVDQDRAQQLVGTFVDRIAELRAEVKRRTGYDVDMWAAASLAPAFDAEGIAYPKTAKTQVPSITKHLLETTDHWLPKVVREMRELDKLRGTFLEGHVLGHLHRGRVHGEIHPLRCDDEENNMSGTVTGRLSMSNPNLQQIPSRTELGRQLRELFVSEVGEKWCKADFSQQEPRLLIHFASQFRNVPGIDRALAFYRDNADADFYTFLQDIAGLTRGESKTLSLARIYGRGVRNTAEQLQVSRDEAQTIFDRLDHEAPFIKDMTRRAQAGVNKRGYICSLFDRRQRFDKWEPRDFDKRDGRMLPLDEARAAWEETALVRARIHKALNSVIQPSAADQTKAAMLSVWREGLGRHVLLQVHDELDNSVPDEATGYRIAELMESAVPLAVPSKVDVGFGKSWGEAK